MRLWSALDPRSKTLFALAVSFALAVAPGTRVLLALPVAGLLLWGAGLTRHRLVAVVKAAAALWILSFAVNAFLISGTRVGPQFLGPIRPTWEGMQVGMGHGARLAALGAVSAWAAGTIGALELAGSLEWSVRRFPGLRRRAHAALFPVVLSLRLIPLLGEEATRLLEVERLRGGDWKGKGRARRVARLGPAWMSAVLDRAEGLALALTLRGYRPDRERGFARSYRFGGWDWLLIGVGGASVLALSLR
jgi:energy-coupling factor transporter transmembrane protein EcfT